MEDILNIDSPVEFDESIAHYEIHAHQPYTSSFNNSDEIRISIQNQDLCLLPSQSSLHIYGKIKKPDDTNVEHVTLMNNAICFLFDEIRYEINAIEIDKCKNVGLTTLMKNWISARCNDAFMLENAGWTEGGAAGVSVEHNGYFDVIIPLKLILGFAEDCHKMVVNVKHELILTRSRTDINAIYQANRGTAAAPTYEDFRIKLEKVEWLMPYLRLSDTRRVRLLNFIEKDKPISMSFRSWELYEYPLLPITSKHIWTVKTSNQLEKPRFVILGFQTERKEKQDKFMTRFDHCNISNVKLFLNSQYYPYGDMNLQIGQDYSAILYDMYLHFQRAYYKREPEPLLSKQTFLTEKPLIVIDCSKQNESMKSAPVDVRIEIEARENFPANTSAYCLILHDRIVQYKPISGDVKKLV